MLVFYTQLRIILQEIWINLTIKPQMLAWDLPKWLLIKIFFPIIRSRSQNYRKISIKRPQVKVQWTKHWTPTSKTTVLKNRIAPPFFACSIPLVTYPSHNSYTFKYAFPPLILSMFSVFPFTRHVVYQALF